MPIFKPSYLIHSLFSLIFALSVYTFNPRVNCYSNRILFNSRYTLFKAITNRENLTPIYSEQLSYTDSCGSHYGRTVTANITNLSSNKQNLTLKSCSNFIIHNQSCCVDSKFQAFTYNLNKIYGTILANVKYPIVQYVYNMSRDLDAFKCSFNRSLMPDSEPFFIIHHKRYREILTKIEQNERQFINETMCLACLGIKDFANFIYPDIKTPQYASFNNLIYERQYFENRVQLLVDLLLQLQALHNDTASYIYRFALSVFFNNPTCILIKQRASNTTYLSQFKLCNDAPSCRKVVVRYFGMVASPQLLYYIERNGAGKVMFPATGSYVISEDGAFGFKGNVGYTDRYGWKFLPNVTVYNETQDYKGLY